MRANELKRGQVILLDNKKVSVKAVQVQSPSSRSGNTLYKMRGQDILTRQKVESSFKGEEVLETVDLNRQAVQMLFRDSDGLTFMDNETYDQYTLSEDVVADEILYISDGIEGLVGLISEGNMLGLELPASVELEIIECAPAMKAASSSARTKPATLSTGLVVQVPEYLASGEKIKVNTDSGEFMARVS